MGTVVFRIPQCLLSKERFFFFKFYFLEEKKIPLAPSFITNSTPQNLILTNPSDVAAIVFSGKKLAVDLLLLCSLLLYLIVLSSYHFIILQPVNMAETKSASRSGSKLNLNESTMPLLDEEAHEKAETPEKDVIEMKEKASTTSEGEKDDSNPEKVVRHFKIF